MTIEKRILAVAAAAAFFAAMAGPAASAWAKGKAGKSSVTFGDDGSKDKKGDKKGKKDKDKAKPEPASKVEAAAQGDRAAGEKIYKINCASCHGIGGNADGVAASKFNPAPINHRNAEVMNARDDAALFRAIKEGARATGRDSAMPAFGAGLNELDIWDLIAYMRTLHVRIDTFVAGGAYYITKSYRVMSPKRIAQAVGDELKPEEEELRVYTVFRFPRHEGYAEYVPYEPGKLDKLKKNLKLGYLAFVKVRGPRGPVEVGMAMEPSAKLIRVAPSDLSAGQDVARLFQKFEGQGKRGKYELWKVAGVPPDIQKDAYKQYLRFLETVFMYEKEEKERTWMDEE
ncbi:MAG: cytochrome c [Deltaproteobacteria bacterium]|nr:cytochrome c [Deltaproteobacteria bacterium]